MRKILVTAISGDIGNGILKILKSEDNILYGCDVNEIAVGMDLVEEFWQCRYAVEEGYVDELLEKCIRYGITHLIPVNEREIEVIGSQRHRFEQADIKVVIQSQRILEICLDKYATAEFLADNGFDVPATYTSVSRRLDTDKRYICKPRKSNGSKDIFVFSGSEAHNSVITDRISDSCILQEYIESDDEYTVGLFRQEPTVNIIIFRRKLKDGYSSQVELTENDTIYNMAVKIAKLLELEGYINIQLRRKDDRYYIFEINPRISGTVRFRHMLGYTDVLWWLDLLDQNEIKPYLQKYKKALGVRELNEKFLFLE